MSTDLGTAVARTKIDNSQLASGIDGAKLLIGGLAAGFAVAGIAAVKMASTFQSGMTSLVTGAGESEKNLGMVSAGILKMAVDTGTSTKQLTDGMYMIESAGYHGAAGLKVLQAAAEGAKVGNADLGTVADATTTLMKDFSNQNLTASQAVNALIATVASGKTHMQDLSAALAQIAPTASAAHVSLNDMMAALATMTGEGVPAANAATYLRQTIMGIEKPSTSSAKALELVGLTSSQVADEMKKSLPDTLQMITDAVGKKFPEGSQAYIAAIGTIAGGAKQMQGMLDLTGQHMHDFQTNLSNISDTVKTSGSTIQGWNLVTQDFGFKLDQARQVVETLAIKVGTALLPALTDLLNKSVIPLMNNFSNWMIQGGGLKDFQEWMQSASVILQNQLVPAFTGLLNNAIVPLAQWVVSLWTDAVNLFQAFQQGQAYADAIAVSLASIGAAIQIIKIEEFAAGWMTTFNAFSKSGGIIANLASDVLPNLGKVLGWTTTEAEATSVSIEGIGVASVESEAVVATAAAGMTVALGVATAGISILIGVIIAAIAHNALTAKTAMQDASQAVQKDYNAVGTTAADTAAKQKADAIEVQAQHTIAAGKAHQGWSDSYAQQVQAAADAKSKMVLDQQLLADAAIRAAAQADAAWVQASNDMNLPALLKASGWTNAQVAKYTGQAQTTDSGTTLPVGGHTNAHAAGGVIAPGTYGTAGEEGTELLYGGSSGISVLDAQNTAALGGGSPVIHNHFYVDGQEITTRVMSRADAAVRARYGPQGRAA